MEAPPKPPILPGILGILMLVGFCRFVYTLDPDYKPHPCIDELSFGLVVPIGESVRLKAGVISKVSSQCRPRDPDRFVWSAGDSSIVQVTQAGVVWAHRPGKTHVTATLKRESGGHKPTMAGTPITVIPAYDSLAIEPARQRIRVGEAASFYLMAYDSLGAVRLQAPVPFYTDPYGLERAEGEWGTGHFYGAEAGIYTISTRQVKAYVEPALLIVDDTLGTR